MIKIKYGYCQCGCGGKTTVAKWNYKPEGRVKDLPMKFITGHHFKLEKYKYKNEKHYCWKGDKVSIPALHDWIKRYYGVPKKCEDCGTTNPNKKYDWANISGKYKRDIRDFKRLCAKCHSNFDIKKHPRGEKSGSSKLTNKQVIKIRRLHLSGKYSAMILGKMFNTEISNVRLIIRRITWKHI